MRVGSGCARGFKILAQGLRALTNDLGHDAGERDGDGEKDYGEVYAEQQKDSGIEVEMQYAGEGLHNGRMQENLFLLCFFLVRRSASRVQRRRARGS